MGGSTAVSSVALSEPESELRLIASLSGCSLRGWHTEGEDYVGKGRSCRTDSSTVEDQKKSMMVSVTTLPALLM